MNALSAVVRGLSRFMYVIAGIALACSMFLTVADVILRQFKVPIVGTYELVGLLGAVVVGFAIPQTSRLQGHVIMDYAVSKLPRTLTKVFSVVTRILAIFTFTIIGWQLWVLGTDLRTSGEVTLTLQLPFYPVAYGISVCCLVECLVLLFDLWEKREGEQAQ
jgi:TRAP-type C4-dicarboxylate transport system permease small subunit